MPYSQGNDLRIYQTTLEKLPPVILTVPVVLGLFSWASKLKVPEMVLVEVLYTEINKVPVYGDVPVVAYDVLGLEVPYTPELPPAPPKVYFPVEVADI